MNSVQRQIEILDNKGNKHIFTGVYQIKKSTSIDQPSGEYETLTAVIINDRLVEVEGYGYFYHPATGETFEI